MRTFALAVLIVLAVLLLLSVAVVEHVQKRIRERRGRRRLIALERAYAAPTARHGDYPYQEWCA